MVEAKGETSGGLQFAWGAKKGRGGTKKNVQFYYSFTFDNVEYWLYDSVYLFDEGDPEPHIGKIAKIWEHSDGRKRVKILWFFQPGEIKAYLGDNVPQEKEIFLACGEGDGLADVNPLETLAGKCCVVCTSKDERNPQPSQNDLAMADYIYYRLFDVGSLTVSEKFPDKIADVEVKDILSRVEDLTQSSASRLEVNGIDENGMVGCAPVLNSSSRSDLRVLDNRLVGDYSGGIVNSATRDNDRDSKSLREGESLPDGKASTQTGTQSAKDKVELLNSVSNHVEANFKSAKSKAGSSLLSDKPSKKMRLSDGSSTPRENIQNGAGAKKSIAGSDGRDASVRDSPQLQRIPSDKKKLTFGSDGDDASVRDSPRLQRIPSDKKKLAENKSKNLDESVQKAAPASSENEKEATYQTVEVTRRPDTDRSKWFKGLTWEVLMEKAETEQTLVYIQNLDPSYTSSDVVDIIYNALNLSCKARVVNHPTFGNPNYGQAYAIFKSRDAADKAVSTINSGCLMLPDGRPLFCSKGMLQIPKPLPTFYWSFTNR
uniref:BAH domain-containing protein n=1 Tax=Ananas comosus var. bracteatus TaxID=296719 RepID=A0A6V7NZA7_ANACO|nr:unnamed protein product [Ananas comosus var. bracteatus]